MNEKKRLNLSIPLPTKRYLFVTSLTVLSLLLNSGPAAGLIVSKATVSPSDLPAAVHSGPASEQEWMQIIDPHRFNYGPEFFDEEKGCPYFDAEQVLLARSSKLVEELERELENTGQSIEEIFDDLSFEYGVSPRILFTLIEMRSHLVDGDADDVAANWNNPLAAPRSVPLGFHTQLTWASGILSRLYLHALEGYDVFPDLDVGTVPQRLDPANYALYSFAELLGYDISQHESRARFAEHFIETYTKLFGDPRSPLSPAQRAMLPRATQEVLPQSSSLDTIAPPFSSPMGTYNGDDKLLVPFRDTETYPYHEGHRHRGLDIVNPHDSVYAAYSGIAYRYGNCAVYIEHDELPPLYEKHVPIRHVRTYYTHLVPDSRVYGIWVEKGEEIGKKATSGDCKQGDEHVHMSVSPLGRGETYYAIDPSPYLGATVNYAVIGHII